MDFPAAPQQPVEPGITRNIPLPPLPVEKVKTNINIRVTFVLFVIICISLAVSAVALTLNWGSYTIADKSTDNHVPLTTEVPHVTGVTENANLPRVQLDASYFSQSGALIYNKMKAADKEKALAIVDYAFSLLIKHTSLGYTYKETDSNNYARISYFKAEKNTKSGLIIVNKETVSYNAENPLYTNADKYSGVINNNSEDLLDSAFGNGNQTADYELHNDLAQDWNFTVTDSTVTGNSGSDKITYKFTDPKSEKDYYSIVLGVDGKINAIFVIVGEKIRSYSSFEYDKSYTLSLPGDDYKTEKTQLQQMLTK